MDKFLIVFDSENHKTGDMLVTTSPRVTCPGSCPYRKGNSNRQLRCYADRGFLGQFIWSGLDRTPPGRTFANNIPVYNFAQLLTAIRCLEAGSVWRHNQAGDLAALAHDPTTIDQRKLRLLIEANTGRSGFTFTHHRVLDHAENRELIEESCQRSFMINLSAGSLTEADALADLNIAPVAVVVAADQRTNLVTPKGRTVVICPARVKESVTCASCRLCTRRRTTIIGFPALTTERR